MGCTGNTNLTGSKVKIDILEKDGNEVILDVEQDKACRKRL